VSTHVRAVRRQAQSGEIFGCGRHRGFDRGQLVGARAAIAEVRAAVAATAWEVGPRPNSIGYSLMAGDEVVGRQHVVGDRLINGPGFSAVRLMSHATG
jgi:hypothetical protein